jgi:hypothetical protein
MISIAENTTNSNQLPAAAVGSTREGTMSDFDMTLHSLARELMAIIDAHDADPKMSDEDVLTEIYQLCEHVLDAAPGEAECPA